MIKVVVRPNELIISGHAQFSKNGTDIVCAAVSSLSQFVANILKEEQIGSFIQEDGYLKIKYQNSELSTKLIDYLIEALKGIEKDYPRNLKLEVK